MAVDNKMATVAAVVIIIIIYNKMATIAVGARGGIVVKALYYKPACRGFNSRWCHWNFSVT